MPTPSSAPTAEPQPSPTGQPEITAVPAQVREDTPTPSHAPAVEGDLPQTGDNAWKTCWFTALLGAAAAAVAVHRLRYPHRKR